MGWTYFVPQSYWRERRLFRSAATLTEAAFLQEWELLRGVAAQKTVWGANDIYWHRGYNSGGWWTWIQWLQQAWYLPDFPSGTSAMEMWVKVVTTGSAASLPRAYWDHAAFVGGKAKPARWLPVKGFRSIGPRGLLRTNFAPIVPPPREVPSGVYYRDQITITSWRYWTD